MKTPSPSRQLEVNALSNWYLSNHRPLPWRETRDPYSIWISEVMLQQTQVATVLPYYRRFLDSFPTLEKLANAPTARVLEHWSGLGYYSRARNLQKGAQYLMEKYQGKFPRTRAQILEVPGIGPYTAGAILSISFDLPEAIVDGNVQRVLTRYFAWNHVLEERETKEWLWQEAALWVQIAKTPRVLNQALMELGATVCRKDKPDCSRCPLAFGCKAYASDQPEKYPVRRPRRQPVDLWWGALVAVHQGNILLQQNKSGEWWADLWSVPFVQAKDPNSVDKALQNLSRTFQGQTVRSTGLGEIRHTVTHHRLHVLPTVMRFKRKPKLPGKWVPAEEVPSMALSSLARKIVRSAVSSGEMVE